VSAGGTATLLGYDLATAEVAPGGRWGVRLYWRGEDKASVSYTVFVHLIDGENRIWGQLDSVPVQGQYPTTGWLPGEIVADDYALAVAAEAPAGAYRLEIGLYDAAPACACRSMAPTAQRWRRSLPGGGPGRGRP
jgi:hypothetical protein